MKDNTQYHFSELFAQAWMKGMTMTNIISGFKTTGIYPFNPQALLPPDKPIANSPIFKQTSLSFIPLISPFPKRYESHKVTDESFTDDKIARYKRRVEEGYDLFDERYEKWIRLNGKCLSRDDDVENISILSSEDTLDNEDDHPVVTRNTNLHRCILQQPLFITKHQRETKASAHVLTSEQCIKVLEEKEQKRRRQLNSKRKGD